MTAAAPGATAAAASISLKPSSSPPPPLSGVDHHHHHLDSTDDTPPITTSSSSSSRHPAAKSSLSPAPHRPSHSHSHHHTTRTAARSSSVSLQPDEHPDHSNLHPRRSSLSQSRSSSTDHGPGHSSSSSTTCASSSTSSNFLNSVNSSLLSAHSSHNNNNSHQHHHHLNGSDKHHLSPIPGSPLPLKRNLSDLSNGYISDTSTLEPQSIDNDINADAASDRDYLHPDDFSRSPYNRSPSPSRQRAFPDLSRRPMSFAPPRMRSPAGKSSASRSRRVILIAVVLLGLIVLGTFIVLSSVSYALYIPAAAFLTEAEVPWKDSDVIRQLHDPANDTAIGEMVEASAAKHLINDDDDDVNDNETYSAVTTAAGSADHQDKQSVWGVDGKGTGGYWMRDDWDGTVHNTSSWERLYDVKLRDGEKIPRIIHQTWKSDVLPEKWRTAWRECREGMPDYEYMLWTDEMSRKFIEEHYPEELTMFDEYRYPIQRADAIRYFILHHFGGVYMDLDIGCRRRMDPLLQGEWDTVLALTKPVGVSNDLIFSARGAPFMEQTIKGLKNFNHEWVINYPTVMFSTGPMFLSAEYSFWQSAHPVAPGQPRAVRILPKSLYGKNAPQETVPHSFFSHFYGSSWHADDAGFITFLGTWGKGLLYVGVTVLVLSVIRLIWARYRSGGGSLRIALPTNNDYQVLPVSTPVDGAHGHAGSGVSSPTHTPLGPLSPTSEAPSWLRLFSGNADRPSPRTPGGGSWLPWAKDVKRNRRGSDAARTAAPGSKRDEATDEEKELMNDW